MTRERQDVGRLDEMVTREYLAQAKAAVLKVWRLAPCQGVVEGVGLSGRGIGADFICPERYRRARSIVDAS